MSVREAAKRWFGKDPVKPGPVYASVATERTQDNASVDYDYLEKVREAWMQWQAAQNYFQSVSDPDLVDYAIYDLEASRRRYMYMLKQAGRDDEAASVARRPVPLA